MQNAPKPSASGSREHTPFAQTKVEEGGYQLAYSELTWWAAGAFAAIVGFSRLSYGFLLPAIRADFHGSFSTYGLIATANLVGYLIGTLIVPVMLTRIQNRIRLNILSLLLMNLLIVVSALSFNLVQLGIWRFLTGFFSALALVLTLALALEHVLPQQRGRASALIWMGISIGVLINGVIAPPIIATGSVLAWRIVWIAMGVLGLVITAGFGRALTKSSSQFGASPQQTSSMHMPTGKREPHTISGILLHPHGFHREQGFHGFHREHAATKVPAAASAQKAETARVNKGKHVLLSTMGELFHPAGLLFLTLAYFGLGFGYIIYFTFFISLVSQQGLPQVLVGLIWAVIGITGIIGAPIWGKWMDRWPTGWLLAANLLAGAVGSAAVLTQQPGIEVIGAIVFGLSLLAAAPAIVTFLLRRAVSEEHYASSFSFMAALFAIGQALGPIVGGFAVDQVGLPLGIATTVLVLLIATIFGALYGIVQKRSQGAALA